MSCSSVRFRCSLQHECTSFTGANFWVSVSEGVQQCPSMTILEPEINIDKENPVRLMPIPNQSPAASVEPLPALRAGNCLCSSREQHSSSWLGCGNAELCCMLLYEAKALGELGVTCCTPEPEPAGCQVCRQTAPRDEPIGKKDLELLHQTHRGGSYNFKY